MKTDLEKLAPDMKAIDRYVKLIPYPYPSTSPSPSLLFVLYWSPVLTPLRLKDVQSGLNEAEEEADETRKESKRARDEFQELKKKRCELFNKAFNHISGCIDTIYKDLTTSKTLKAGGTAQLYSDDAEVSSQP